MADRGKNIVPASANKLLKKARAQDKEMKRLQKGFAYVRKHKAKHGSIKEGAKRAGMPYNTFYDRWMAGQKPGPTFHGPPPALGRDTEQALVDHVFACAEVAMCLPVLLVCAMARQLAEKLKIKTNVTWGDKWFAGFRRRHPSITVRQPQLIESFRLTAVSSMNMSNYFEVLGKATKDVPPEKIWNMDESGISLRNTRSKVCSVLRVHFRDAPLTA